MAATAQHHVRVAVEKFIRGQVQTDPQPDHVVGIEQKREVAAAAVETGDPRLTAESERLPRAEAHARQFVQAFEVELFHSPTSSSSSIAAMVIRIFRRQPAACRHSASSRAKLAYSGVRSKA